MVSVYIPDVKAIDAPSSSGAGDVVIERHEAKTIKGRAKSGAGEDIDSYEGSQAYSKSIQIVEANIKEKISLKKVSSITEKQILKFLKEEPLNIEGLVDKWHEKEGLNLHYKELHFELIKEKIFLMIKDKKIEQSFEYTQMLLKVKK